MLKAFPYYGGRVMSTSNLNIYHLYVGDFESNSDLVKVRSIIDYLGAYISDSFWYQGIRSYFEILENSFANNVTSSILFNARSSFLIPSNYNDSSFPKSRTQSVSFADADIQRAITLKLATGNIPVNLTTVYMVIFRGNFQVRDQNGNQWLSAWCGYHGKFLYNGVNITYGVVGDPFSISGNNSWTSDAKKCIAPFSNAASTYSESSSDTVAMNLGAVYATTLAGILTNPYGTGWYKREQPLNPPSSVVEVGDVCNKDFDKFVSEKIGHAEINFRLPQIYRLGHGCWPSMNGYSAVTGWYYYDASIGLDSRAYLPLGLKTMVDGSSIQEWINCNCSRYSWGNNNHTLVEDTEGYPLIFLFGKDTALPSETPTMVVSRTSLAPTALPSCSPSYIPTSPTLTPSFLPTAAPTVTWSPSPYLYPCSGGGDSAGGINDCNYHANVIISMNSSSVADFAFQGGCTGIEYIYIPTTITRIGQAAFSRCASLTNIFIPTTVTVITVSMLQFSGLYSIVIPTSIVSIQAEAFDSMPHLTTVVIPTSVTSIGVYAFANCPNLNCVVIPPNFEYMTTGGKTFVGSPLKGCPTAAPSTWAPTLSLDSPSSLPPSSSS